MQTLEQLAIKYSTDKYEHGYMPFYEKHLPKEPKRILEIGVKQGYSVAMWGDYFPNTEIHILDLFAEYTEHDVAEFLGLPFDDYKGDKNRFHFHKGNQCDWRILELLRKFDFDVIIDDGSHNSRDQLMTLFGLFNGKHYFIEDLHCCREEFYQQGLPPCATVDSQYDFQYDSDCPPHPFMHDRDENIILFKK